MPKIIKKEDQHWRNKWQNRAVIPSKRKLFINSGGESLRQFCYEQTYRVLENFLKIKGESKPLEDSKILEVGCGSGTTSINILKNYPDAKMYMVDLSFDAIRVAKKNISEENLKAFFVVADAEQLPFKNSVFSTVFSIGLLEHFLNPALSITEQCRLLKENGLWMALVVPTKFSLDNFVLPFYQFFKKVCCREKKLLGSFRKALTLAFGPRKPTPFRNALLDDFYKKTLNGNEDMGDIKCVYLSPYFTSVKDEKIGMLLFYIYAGITKFRRVFLLQKMPFSAFKSIARSFFITACREERS